MQIGTILGTAYMDSVATASSAEVAVWAAVEDSAGAIMAVMAAAGAMLVVEASVAADAETAAAATAVVHQRRCCVGA